MLTAIHCLLFYFTIVKKVNVQTKLEQYSKLAHNNIKSQVNVIKFTLKTCKDSANTTIQTAMSSIHVQIVSSSSSHAFISPFPCEPGLNCSHSASFVHSGIER